jgi:hypothetical protein
MRVGSRNFEFERKPAPRKFATLRERCASLNQRTLLVAFQLSFKHARV